MSDEDEFAIVDLILNSGRRTRAIDAFALSLIKTERQVRRLVTHLVFQSTTFRDADKRLLRRTLAANNHVYFEGVVRGFDALSPVTLRSLVGGDYDRLYARLEEAGKHRNKVFHGQITADGLSRAQLEAYVTDIRLWCGRVAGGATREFHYDGFGNSLRKSELHGLASRLRIQIASIQEYATFIKQHMERANNRMQRTRPAPATEPRR